MRRDAMIRPLLIAWIAGMILGFVGPAAAQNGGGDGGAVEDALRRTDEGLARATEIVRESDSLRAREVLDRATQIQQQAWDRFQGGRRVMAGRLTLEARDIGARSVRIAREAGQLRSRAQREGERAMRILRRAREDLGPDAGAQTLRLLDEARAQIDRGVVQFREQHFEAALRLAISAQRLVRQAVGASSGSAAAPRVLRELERTDRLIERALPIVRDSGDPAATAILDRATDLQATAWDAHRDGRPRVAHASTREGRGLVNRALGLVRGATDPARIEKALADTDALIGRVADVVRESGHDTSIRLLETARKHQTQAHELHSGGRMKEALAKTRVARRLATRAAGLAEGGSGR